MEKGIIFIFLLLIIIGFVLFVLVTRAPTSPTSTVTPTPSPTIAPAPSYYILDFEEAIKFNSIEETKNYRFKMSVGKDYRIQEYWVYQYFGDGLIKIKDFSDPDFVREMGFIVQVGNSFAIGGYNVKGRHYLVKAIEVGSKDLILRIEKIMGED